MLELYVCVGSSCHVKGSYNVIQTFQQMIEENSLHDKIDFKAIFCMKQCLGKGISVKIGSNTYSVFPENAMTFFLETILPLVD